MKPFSSSWRLVLALFVFVLFGGCSSFEKEWRGADRTRLHGGIPRKWEGRWTSTKHHGMGGRLRCVLTQVDATHHRAWFRASWLTFASDYMVTLQTRPAPGGLRLRGEHVLHGFGGGLYRYAGLIAGDRFDATYESKYDRGQFSLQSALRDSSMPQLTTRAPIQ
ncbi:MAG TPA: hypothetical protein VFV83_09880 [Chthoniobacteraceae bacterium]|nr:hypothetical protein [Chthoniobacteraceae bacterium]